MEGSIGRQAGRQSDKILVDLNSFKILLIPLLGFSQHLMKERYYHNITNVFGWVGYIVRRVVEAQKSGMLCFLCQSLLIISTTVLTHTTSYWMWSLIVEMDGSYLSESDTNSNRKQSV